MAAQQSEAVREAVREVLDGDAPNPALQANVPTRGETERENDRLVETAMARAVSEMAWAKRHSGDEFVFNGLIARVTSLLNQSAVYVLRYEACECAGEMRDILASWHVSEAKRDAARDVVTTHAAPGDVVTTYTVGLPKPLRDLTDSSIDKWVEEDVTIEDSAVWSVTMKQYGVCPDCGRSEYPPSDSEALDRIAGIVEGFLHGGEDNTVEDVYGVLRETGSLRSEGRPSIGPDVDRWDEDGESEHEAWLRSLDLGEEWPPV